SGPVVLMARLSGVPTAICEQNSIPGLTNKILGRLVRAVFVSSDGARRFFRPSKTVVSGNPVRRALVERLATATGGAKTPETMDDASRAAADAAKMADARTDIHAPVH